MHVRVCVRLNPSPLCNSLPRNVPLTCQLLLISDVIHLSLSLPLLQKLTLNSVIGSVGNLVSVIFPYLFFLVLL